MVGLTGCILNILGVSSIKLHVVGLGLHKNEIIIVKVLDIKIAIKITFNLLKLIMRMVYVN